MKAVVGCFGGIAFPGEGGVKGIEVFVAVAIIVDDDNELAESLAVVKLYSIVKEREQRKKGSRSNKCCTALPPATWSLPSLFSPFCFQLSLGIFYILLSSLSSCYTAHHPTTSLSSQGIKHKLHSWCGSSVVGVMGVFDVKKLRKFFHVTHIHEQI